MAELSLNIEFQNLIKQAQKTATNQQKAQISFKLITLSKEKLVSSYTRPQYLNQQNFCQTFRTFVSTRKIFTTKTLYLIFMGS